MTLEEAIEKAQKLLNLAQSDNVNESAAAAAQAQKILDKYEISKAMLDDNTSPDDEDIEHFDYSPLDEASKFNLDSWRSRLAQLVCKYNMCTLYTTTTFKTKQIILIGRPSDVDKVRYIYSYLTAETDRLCKRDCEGTGRTWRNNFRHGVVDTLIEKFRESRDETIKELKIANVDSTALIKVENALQSMENKRNEAIEWRDENLQLTNKTINMNSPRRDARNLGRQSGQEINVNNKARGALNG